MSLRTSFRFNIILGNARDAVSTIREGSEDAQASIILSAVSLEAFVHEFGWLLGSNTMGARGDPTLETLKETLVDLESSRAQLLTKIRISYFLLSGEHLPKGTSAYQDLHLLFRIRNELVHPKVVSFDSKAPEKKQGIKIVRALSARGVIPKETETNASPWTRDVLTKPVAIWAVNVAYAGMVDFVSQLPEHHETREVFESALSQFEPL